MNKDQNHKELEIFYKILLGFSDFCITNEWGSKFELLFSPQNESSFKLTRLEKKWSSKFEANILQKPTTRLTHAPRRNEQKICPSTLNSPLHICKNPNLKCALMNPKQKAWQDAHT
jgi:hypothetical protein